MGKWTVAIDLANAAQGGRSRLTTNKKAGSEAGLLSSTSYRGSYEPLVEMWKGAYRGQKPRMLVTRRTTARTPRIMAKAPEIVPVK